MSNGLCQKARKRKVARGDRPPNPPPDIIPLCCPRLVLIDNPAIILDIPPDVTTVLAGHPRPSIQYEGSTPNCSTHGRRQLAIEYRSQERCWIRSIGYPPRCHDCQPMLLHEPTRPDAHPNTEMQWEHLPDGEDRTHLVNQLRAAPPVPWQQLLTTITTNQHLN